MYDIYKNIKKYRIMNGWSQEDLAKKSGYNDRSSIAKIERGDIDLPQSKIFMFAEVFGISPNELMGNDGVSDNEISPTIRAAARDMMDLEPADQEFLIDVIRKYKETKGKD